MIFKELDPCAKADRFSKAGHDAEKQLAFYLKRGFGRDKKVHVFNSVRLEHDDDAAQIDHLILHPYGFIVIESKSVSGSVQIDRHGHWTRWFNRTPGGMGSPLLQAERQVDFLKTVFADRREEVIGTFLGLQQGLGGRTYDVLVAISDNGRITCERGMTLDPRICKADEVVSRVKAIVAAHKPSLRNPRIPFSTTDVDWIKAFLLENHCLPGSEASAVSAPAPFPGFGESGEPSFAPPTPARPPSPPPEPVPDGGLAHACGKCGSGGGLRILNGKYGYYFKCGACGGNTKAQATCGACGKPARVRKQRLEFFAECKDCGASQPYFTNPSEEADAAE